MELDAWGSIVELEDVVLDKLVPGDVVYVVYTTEYTKKDHPTFKYRFVRGEFVRISHNAVLLNNLYYSVNGESLKMLADRGFIGVFLMSFCHFLREMPETLD